MTYRIDNILKYIALALTIVLMGCNSKDEPDTGDKVDDESVIAVPERDDYVTDSEKGTLTIPVKSNGKLTAEVYPSDCDWVKVTKVSKPSSGDDWSVTLAIDHNTGFGRIAAIDLKVNGVSPVECRNPYIVQQPEYFSEEVIIEPGEAGRLQVLLGDDTKNLRRIRRLTVKSNINAIDLAELKKLLVISKSPDHDNPISLDLSDARIVSGTQNPFEAYRWQPTGVDDTSAIFPDEIPNSFFADAVNLVNIDLPKNLKGIGSTAFKGCSGLTSIAIPHTVQAIRSQAFWQCPNLTEIEIPVNSQLTTLGNEVFATESVIESLSLPACLTELSAATFGYCKVKNLHLHWTNPQPLNIVPQTEGCTLYVPEGTSDLYRSTPNWSSFDQIVEE